MAKDEKKEGKDKGEKKEKKDKTEKADKEPGDKKDNKPKEERKDKCALAIWLAALTSYSKSTSRLGSCIPVPAWHLLPDCPQGGLHPKALCTQQLQYATISVLAPRRKDKASSGSGKKAKENEAAPSRPPPQLKKKAPAGPKPKDNGYLAGVDLPSSSDSEEEVEVKQREEKHGDMSTQARALPPLAAQHSRCTQAPCLHSVRLKMRIHAERLSSSGSLP
jgi:hypothetical protein